MVSVTVPLFSLASVINREVSVDLGIYIVCICLNFHIFFFFFFFFFFKKKIFFLNQKKEKKKKKKIENSFLLPEDIHYEIKDLIQPFSIPLKKKNFD